MKNIKIILLATVLITSCVLIAGPVVLAQVQPVISGEVRTSGIKDFNSAVSKLTSIGNVLIRVLISLAIVWIIFNVVRYLIISGDNAEKRQSAQQAIIWGVVGLFVIISIWGFVRLLTGTFRFDNNNAPTESFPTTKFKR
jgi:uncharacterized membrane protein YidH (DUF202 family)